MDTDGSPGGRSPGSLRTGRLVLEPLSVRHAAEMVEVLASPELYRFTGETPPTLEDLTARYQRQVAGPDHPDEVWRNWIVRLGGRAVGFVQATIRGRQGTRVAEVAWLVRPEAQGRGVAGEAAAAMVAHLRAHEGVAVVRAHIADAHLASAAVARRIGLAPTDRLVDGERRWSDERPAASGPAASGPAASGAGP